MVLNENSATITGLVRTVACRTALPIFALASTSATAFAQAPPPPRPSLPPPSETVHAPPPPLPSSMPPLSSIDFVGPVWLDFSFAMPSNTGLMKLGLAAVLVLAAWVLLYRLLLHSQVERGVHPNIVRNSLGYAAVIILTLCAHFLLDAIGAGYFILLCGLVAMSIIVLLIMKRLVAAWIIGTALLSAIIFMVDYFDILT